MGYVIYDKSMSLDGYIAGANMRVEAGLGDDGERLHDWAFKDSGGMELIQREVGNLGAVICGRRTYDMSIPALGRPAARRPRLACRCSCSRTAPRTTSPRAACTRWSAVVRDGVGTGARDRRAIRNISVMGADTGRQFLDAGVIDEDLDAPRAGAVRERHAVVRRGRGRARHARVRRGEREPARRAPALPRRPRGLTLREGCSATEPVLREHHPSEGELVIGFARDRTVLPALRLDRGDGRARVPSVWRSLVPDGPFETDAGTDRRSNPSAHEPPAESPRHPPLRPSMLLMEHGIRRKADPPSAVITERGRWKVVALALVLTAAVAFGLTRGGESELARRPGGQEQARADAETPAGPSRFEPGNRPSPRVHRVPAGYRGRHRCPSPAGSRRLATADYLLPELAREQPGNRTRPHRGRGVAAASSRWTQGPGTTVLRFAGGRGLALAPTTGVVPSSEIHDRGPVPVRLPLRFRKIIDFKQRRRRRMACTHAGRMPDLLPEGARRRHHRSGRIRTCRSSSRATPPTRSSAYVDGVRQFAFRDARGPRGGRADRKTLRFFVDDHHDDRGVVQRCGVADPAVRSGTHRGRGRGARVHRRSSIASRDRFPCLEAPSDEMPQTAQTSSSGATRSPKSSSCSIGSPTGHRNRRWTPASA